MLSIISKQFYSVWKGTLLLASLLGSLKWPWIAEQWLFWTQINGIFQSWMFLRRSVQVHRLMCENPWVSHCFYMVRMDNQQSFTFDFDGNSWLCNCPRDIEVCWSKSNYKWRFHLRQRIKHKQMSLPVSAWLIRFTRAFVLFCSHGRSCKPIKYQKKNIGRDLKRYFSPR